MQEQQTPTLRDIACLLQVAGGGEYLPETAGTARWLIEQSQKPRELYAELTAKPGGEPSLIEFVRLLCAVRSEEPMPEVLDTARWLVSQSEPAAAHLEHLEQIAVATGRAYRSLWWTTLIDLEQDLERLAEAADDWQHPSDVLDPTRDFGVNVRALYSLCQTRIGRSASASQRLEPVLEKLERVMEMERLLPLSQHRFERLSEWLAELKNPEHAAASLGEMARLLRSTLDSPDVEAVSRSGTPGWLAMSDVCLVWLEEKKGYCVFCGDKTGAGLAGWHPRNPQGPVCDTCLCVRESTLGALLRKSRTQSNGGTD